MLFRSSGAELGRNVFEWEELMEEKEEVWGKKVEGSLRAWWEKKGAPEKIVTAEGEFVTKEQRAERREKELKEEAERRERETQERLKMMEDMKAEAEASEVKPEEAMEKPVEKPVEQEVKQDDAKMTEEEKEVEEPAKEVKAE